MDVDDPGDEMLRKFRTERANRLVTLEEFEIDDRRVMGVESTSSMSSSVV